MEIVTYDLISEKQLNLKNGRPQNQNGNKAFFKYFLLVATFLCYSKCS
jgi:hypothetical protein